MAMGTREPAPAETGYVGEPVAVGARGLALAGALPNAPEAGGGRMG